MLQSSTKKIIQLIECISKDQYYFCVFRCKKPAIVADVSLTKSESISSLDQKLLDLFHTVIGIRDGCSECKAEYDSCPDDPAIW